MKRILQDHGHILHWMGVHHMFPVKGATADDVGFGAHGELEGKSPIGWNEFFPALALDHVKPAEAQVYFAPWVSLTDTVSGMTISS